MKQDSFLGVGKIERHLPIILKENNINNVLIIRSKNSFSFSGAEGKIMPIINRNKVSYEYFYDFDINPKIEDVEECLLIMSQYKFNAIIAIGGGSVLDMAKLVRFLFSYTGCVETNTFTQIKPILPLIVFPTTAGTGSEVTHFAVVYINKIKYSVSHWDIKPNIAFIDASFTYKIDNYLTACTGFDALAQAIESFWNVYAVPESDEYAQKAISLLWKSLPLVVKHPTKKLRNIISEGAFWAGKAINITKTTAPHAFSYPFTSYYGYPHGHAVAMTFPFFTQYNYCSTELILSSKLNFMQHRKKMDYLYDLLEIDDCENSFVKMKDYIEGIGLSLSITKEIDLNRILSNVNIERLENNPCIVKKTKDIFNSITYERA